MGPRHRPRAVRSRLPIVRGHRARKKKLRQETKDSHAEKMQAVHQPRNVRSFCKKGLETGPERGPENGTAYGSGYRSLTR